MAYTAIYIYIYIYIYVYIIYILYIYDPTSIYSRFVGVRDFAVFMFYIRVRGFPLNGIFDPCAGCLLVAAGYDGCWRVVVGVILYRYHCWDPKSINIDKIHKIHAPKFQGVFLLRSPKRRRQLRHRRTAQGG